MDIRYGKFVCRQSKLDFFCALKGNTRDANIASRYYYDKIKPIKQIKIPNLESFYERIQRIKFRRNLCWLVCLFKSKTKTFCF